MSRLCRLILTKDRNDDLAFFGQYKTITLVGIHSKLQTQNKNHLQQVKGRESIPIKQ